MAQVFLCPAGGTSTEAINPPPCRSPDSALPLVAPEPVRAPGWGRVWGTIWVTSLRAGVTRVPSSQCTNPVCSNDGTMAVTLPPAPLGSSQVWKLIQVEPSQGVETNWDLAEQQETSGDFSCHLSLSCQMSPPGRE